MVQDTLKASEKAIRKYRVRPTTPVSYQVARRIPLSLGAMLILALIDIGGFYNGVNKLTGEKPIVNLIIIAAFTVGFEVAPGFLGYGMDLWIYKVSEKKLYRYIIIFSAVSFGIGFIANCFLRIQGIINSKNLIEAGTNDSTIKINIWLMITMILLPLITSFISLVIGLLSFDPLVMKLIGLYEKRAKLSTQKVQLEGKLKVYELKTEDEKIEERKKSIIKKAEDRKKHLNDIEKELGRYAISLVYQDEYIDI